MGIRFPEPLFPDDADYNAQQERSTKEGIVINPEPVNVYMAEIGEFNRTILDNREPGINASIGLQNQKILTACYESVRTGKVLLVEE